MFLKVCSALLPKVLGAPLLCIIIEMILTLSVPHPFLIFLPKNARNDVFFINFKTL
jgi:hypothetical protein